MWIVLEFEEFLDLNFLFDFEAVLGALKFDLKIISIINSERKLRTEILIYVSVPNR